MLARLHLVTDDSVLRAPGFIDRARAVLAAHGDDVALHLRGHGLSGGELFALARPLAVAVTGLGGALLLNDRVDIALAAGADGVQLGRRSLPVPAARSLLGADAWIGRSAHQIDEAADAVADGVDFIVFGTVYRSASHPDRTPAGPDALGRVAASGDSPVVGIGGITPERVGAVLAAGAAGVAVLSGVWHADDPAAAAGRYLASIAGGDDHGHHDGND